jgi:branched-chain amino acid transport system permease protein
VSAHRTPVQTVFAGEKAAITGAIVLVAALVPFIDTSQYGMGVMIIALIICILNVSWNFLLGMAGVWNFGQLAIYAAGGYGGGLLILHTGVPAWVGIIGGGVAGTLLAIVIAVPSLRLYGIYTSLLTFAAAEVVQLVIQNDDTGTTGGAFGLPPVGGLFTHLSPLWSQRAWYWLCLALLVACMVVVSLMARSSFGLALKTLRDSLPYGSARGIDPRRHQIMAFALSGFMAGIAGALYTLYNGSISPTVMGLTPMSIYVTMLVVGGLGTFSGPIIGTVLLSAVQQALVDHPGTQLTVLGIVLLLIVIFFPRGLAAEAEKVRRRVVAWTEETEDDDERRPSPSDAVAAGAPGG